MQPIKAFTDKNFISICDTLAIKDPDLLSIISQYGNPPLWKRPASFETLIHIILEQQVSLASALAALNKLKERIIEITPNNLLMSNWYYKCKKSQEIIKRNYCIDCRKMKTIPNNCGIYFMACLFK